MTDDFGGLPDRFAYPGQQEARQPLTNQTNVVSPAVSNRTSNDGRWFGVGPRTRLGLAAFAALPPCPRGCDVTMPPRNQSRGHRPSLSGRQWPRSVGTDARASQRAGLAFSRSRRSQRLSYYSRGLSYSTTLARPDTRLSGGQNQKDIILLKIVIACGYFGLSSWNRLSLQAIPLVFIVSAVSCGAPNRTIYTKLRRTQMSL